MTARTIASSLEVMIQPWRNEKDHVIGKTVTKVLKLNDVYCRSDIKSVWKTNINSDV